MLGNTLSKQSAYGILAEMMSVDYLYKKGYDPHWEGQNGNVRDIVGSDYSVEVKSTLSRYSKTIEAAGEFQFEVCGDLLLFFCRFEESDSGISIDNMVDLMDKDGCMRRDEVDSVLSSSGFPRGRTARKKKYRLIEFLSYDVDEQFPRIDRFSFKNDVLPKGISHIGYTIDLDVIDNYVVLEYDPHETQ